VNEIGFGDARCTRGRGGSLLPALFAVLIALLISGRAWAHIPADAAIRKILADRIGGAQGVGIVVGIVEPDGRRIIAYGGDHRPFNGDTVFEIGSVTKVFTALLLADMVQRSEVALDDPVGKFLPTGLRIPSRNGRSITLVDLATHTSGLPFMTDQPLERFLASYELTRDIGTQWDYSNIGYWLLAQALTSRTNTDFGSLLRTRIARPLNLNSTAMTLSPRLQSRLAAGHDANLQPAPPILTVPLYTAMASAGGLLSTANDLCTFLTSTMLGARSRLAQATTVMLATRRPLGPNREQALGWVVIGQGDDELIAHDGGTLGYASAVAWDPKTRTGVIVLENQAGDVSDIAYHLLRPGFPLAKSLVAKHKEIALDQHTLDLYTGRYDVPGEGVFTIGRDGGMLAIESPPDWGLPTLRLRPESPRDFFVSEIPLRVTFQTGSDGRASGMLVYPPRGQAAVRATRIKEQ
jgi:D-alanyl-D-alanine-carboxypeptidase/D-alanyl-D-alanine-endopeptidase